MAPEAPEPQLNRKYVRVSACDLFVTAGRIHLIYEYLLWAEAPLRGILLTCPLISLVADPLPRAL